MRSANAYFPAPSHDWVVWLGMIVLPLVVVAVSWRVFRSSSPCRRLWVLWTVTTLSLAAAGSLFGLLSQRFPRLPYAQLLFAGCVGSALWWALFSYKADALRTLQPDRLVALNVFRLPLEMVMLRAAELQIMPLQFSILGWNFDLLTGASALVLTLYYRRRSIPRWALRLWNAWAWACLGVIALLAVATSPQIALWGHEVQNLNLWVLFFPYVWLPSVLVGVAVASQVLLTRQLWHTRLVRGANR